MAEVEKTDKPLISFSTIISLNAYESKKSHFIRSNRLTPYSFSVLLTVVNHYVYNRTGITAFGIIGTKDYTNYQTIYDKLTTLSDRGFIDCNKRADRVNVFTPTLKAIEGINSLLVEG